jgi:hypothetical protein
LKDCLYMWLLHAL